MKVKELIAKLQKVDPELDAIIEPYIDAYDTEYGPYCAYDVLFNKNIAPITFRYSQAESNRKTENDFLDEVDYDCFTDSIDKKKVLVISSPELKNGTTEEEEDPEFK